MTKQDSMPKLVSGAVSSPEAMAPPWYKDAIIYQVHVKSFFDSNNDGIGDFPGLTSKLDYIADLGVNAIWLLPFYKSPGLDDGYDIADYRAVHPDYGTLADVKRFIAAAHERGIRVITELVVNHTSDQHPWFQRARQSKPGSIYRDFYVWSKDDRKYSGTRIIFIDSERSNWTWDETAQAYYWHRFYHHQPDLNFDNPRVMDEVLSVMRYWAGLGVDGLRLDAVPYLVEREGTNNENLPETHRILKRIRSELETHYPDRMLLAEANQWPEDTKDYFGDGDECHMAFHFPLMPRMYMAIAQEDRFPITDILRQTPAIPPNCQWAIFLRNHDELTLEMVTASERDFLWETYASDRRARINLGIRRRLAPLMQNDRRRIELMNYLLLSMSGTPVIYYGDEIGMGDNIHLGDRNGVRTPMQWSNDRNGGFSRVADPSRLVLPPVMDPLYAYQSINAETQASDPHSLLSWMRRAIAIRRQYSLFGNGRYRLLYPRNRKILAYYREDETTVILCVANLSRTPQAVELDLKEFAGRIPVELDGHSVFPPIGQLTYLLTLPPYGFYWFKLAESQEWPTDHTPTPEPLPEYQTIVMRGGLMDGVLFARDELEREILPAYLQKRRWFGMKNHALRAVRIARMTRLPHSETMLLEVETETDGGSAQWLIPCGVVWEDTTATPLQSQLMLARVRRAGTVGMLTDAFVMPGFVQAVLTRLRDAENIPTDDGAIRFEPTSRMRDVTIPEDAEMNWIAAEQSNSSVIIGDAAMLKMFRRVTEGPHPEAEMGRYLTDGGYANIPALLGEIVRTGQGDVRHTLGVVQSFVRNQGDAWTWTLERLLRGVSAMTPGDTEEDAGFPEHEGYGEFAAILGKRLAEMHLVLARQTDQPDFVPVAANGDTADTLARRITQQIEQAYKALEAPHDWDAAAEQNLHTVQGARQALADRLRMMASRIEGERLIRIHGDLHLGQVLVANGDVFIIDFEGEPAKPVEERRAKDHPLRDVAGVIRSFSYAAAVVQRRSQSSHAHVAERQIAAFIEAFVPVATRSFLDGYRAAIAQSEHGESLGFSDDILSLFLMEKAAYEVVYEAANRPAWIDVPLHGLATQVKSIMGVSSL